jgi:hypothetical protein
MSCLVGQPRIYDKPDTYSKRPVMWRAISAWPYTEDGSSKCPNPSMTGVMVGCCKHGFRAGKGWDPLTGLGSIDFQRLRDELLKLP